MSSDVYTLYLVTGKGLLISSAMLNKVAQVSEKLSPLLYTQLPDRLFSLFLRSQCRRGNSIPPGPRPVLEVVEVSMEAVENFMETVEAPMEEVEASVGVFMGAVEALTEAVEASMEAVEI